ncbi:hypothetical protein [uncultured Tenacibaculum sp.]|uniref:hypothetical protein n=1 Tax=uncultured Tenacibaculum sp. TaxID=174713 RepID=UPI002626B9B0|nr:hypothetical protein [uncultured Tenacibaculum sp.]
MKFKYVNLNKEEKVIDLPVTEEDFNETKCLVEGSEFIDMDYDWLIWDLRDYFVEKMVLDPFKEEIYSFCKKIQLADFDYKENASSKDVKVVQMYYHIYSWHLIFVACEPEITFHKEDIVKDRLELDFNFDLRELEYLLEQILDALEVDYSEFKEEEKIVTSDLIIDFSVKNILKECWNEIKNEINSKIVGVVFQATGGDPESLDTDEVIGNSEELIVEFFKKRNIKA